MMLRGSLTALLAATIAFSGISLAAPTSSKPAVILVPGAFHKAQVYNQVKALLSTKGYDRIYAVDLPSVGPLAAKVNRKPDIKAVQQLIRKETDSKRDVVLVGNSYGATVIGDAVKDFEALSSTKPGVNGKGRVLGIVMLSGFIPYISELSGARPDVRLIAPTWFRFEDTSRVYWDNDLVNFPPSFTFYNLLPPPQAAYWTSQLAPSSFAATNATAQYIPYDGKFRSLYVIGEQDNCVTPAQAMSYIEQPGAKFEVLTLDADHVPMLSRPGLVVDVIRRFVGDKV